MTHIKDDGTLDTVVYCDTCGATDRYTFDSGDPDDTLESFVAWAIEDFDDNHECPNPNADIINAFATSYNFDVIPTNRVGIRQLDRENADEFIFALCGGFAR